jgi:protein-tyrosine phosphatase
MHMNLMQKLSAVYGSRRGFLRLLAATTLMYAGGYRQLEKVDFSRVNRFVFVCKGNICRSVYAEICAARLNMAAVSCGVEADFGSPANDRVQAAAQRRGLSLASHKSRPASAERFADGDLLVGMEVWQLEALRPHCAGAQMTLLGLWSVPRRPYLHDPYGAGDSYMDVCLDTIESGVRRLAERARGS